MFADAEYFFIGDIENYLYWLSEILGDQGICFGRRTFLL